MHQRQGIRSLYATAAVTLVLTCSGALGKAEDTPPPGGTIAYALTDLRWAVYASADGKTECPAGFNEGNREEFQKLFPNDGTKRTLLDTELRREIDSWYPTTAPEPFAFHEAGGTTAYGLNLDGKVGPNDFTSPEGEKGIDNQLYRVIGCLNGYRSPDSVPQGSDNIALKFFNFNRIIIQLTDVQSLVNDADVKVNIFRGQDSVQIDVNKNPLPGGFQRIDTRWGAKYIYHLHGKITDGVLTTDTIDWVYPSSGLLPVPTDQYLYGAQFKLRLAAAGAEGLIGGYADIESWYLQLMRTYATHYHSYGQLAPPSIYKALRRLADARPDPQTGANSAISSALLAKFTLVLMPPTTEVVGAAASQGPKVSSPQRFPFRRAAAEEVYQNLQQSARAGGSR